MVLSAWLRNLGSALKTTSRRLTRSTPAAIPVDLWQNTLARYPFLSCRPEADRHQLKQLAELFLQQKEFHGAQDLVVSDAMAVAIAAQASLPLLNMGAPSSALQWYDDFVGIVVHPAEVIARRETIDETGVVHHYHEVVSGEAMAGGPVTLSWQDVAQAGQWAEQGYNVVIHEFIHKMDMRTGEPDGCPPLPPGFMGTAEAAAGKALWRSAITSAWQDFREKVIIAERFGGTPTWLDPYGAESPEEFFAVTSEAYLVNRERFEADFFALVPVYDAFFRPAIPAG